MNEENQKTGVTIEFVDDTNLNPKFSFAFAFWGVFGYFFHKNQLNTKKSFFKSAGSDIFVWMFLCGILDRIVSFLVEDNAILSILESFGLIVLTGFVGAWRFNKHKIAECSIDTWKKREKYGLISGVVLYTLLLIGGFAYSFISEYAEASSINENIYVVENGIACDKFFDVSEGLSIETEKQIDNVLERIHTYCPSDVYFRENYGESNLFKQFPQLRTYDFKQNPSFIHTYETDKNATAYVYVKFIGK